MHLPATATQVAHPALPRIRMLAAVQLLLARLLAFLCANQLGVTDIGKRYITTAHLSEETLMPSALTHTHTYTQTRRILCPLLCIPNSTLCLVSWLYSVVYMISINHSLLFVTFNKLFIMT